MCGVPVNAPSDMTGLGGKARMVGGTSASQPDTTQQEKQEEFAGSKESLLQEVLLMNTHIIAVFVVLYIFPQHGLVFF